MKPDLPKLVGRFRTPSCQNLYPWYTAIWSERESLALSFYQGKDRAGPMVHCPNFSLRLLRGLSSVFPVWECWWDQHNLAACGRTLVVTTAPPSGSAQLLTLVKRSQTQTNIAWSALHEVNEIVKFRVKEWNSVCQGLARGGNKVSVKQDE